MPKYLISIHEDESWWAEVDEAGMKAAMDAHGDFTKAIADLGGVALAGEALQATPSAKSIRGGVVTDGPFVETKEAFGGYYLIEANDMDHAVEIAKLCPAGGGGVEVRPIWDVPDH